jgi:DNA-binding NtrC family response regulator
VEAHGGTLLLDEVGELDPVTQGKLLRVLQEGEVRPVGEVRPKKVDVRILAATNKDLVEEVSRGRFREDLYYRLHVVEIRVPPLRERPEDIGPLAEHFVALYGERYGLPSAALSPRLIARLRQQTWPGNVRELENAVERMVALARAPLIEAEPLSGRRQEIDAPSGRLSLKERIALFEKSLVAEELDRCHGNQSETARRLGISRTALIDKLKKYDLR